MLERKYSREEFARRGKSIYASTVRPQVATSDDGKFVAIDIESQDFVLDADDFTATERLLSMRPDAQIWLARVGDKATYRIGSAAAAFGT